MGLSRDHRDSRGRAAPGIIGANVPEEAVQVELRPSSDPEDREDDERDHPRDGLVHAQRPSLIVKMWVGFAPRNQYVVFTSKTFRREPASTRSPAPCMVPEVGTRFEMRSSSSLAS